MNVGGFMRLPVGRTIMFIRCMARVALCQWIVPTPRTGSRWISRRNESRMGWFYRCYVIACNQTDDNQNTVCTCLPAHSCSVLLLQSSSYFNVQTSVEASMRWSSGDLEKLSKAIKTIMFYARIPIPLKSLSPVRQCTIPSGVKCFQHSYIFKWTRV